ncbi:uncharacterized protein B0I36DRAFT_375379 [Microdochium trichocladiopsis]|uniref:C2 domain-containing protein n=1 Tax=Microdochium trichocladiopsis TaxID=1682393 RepID=A0A9P9BNB8_9PEZI|nr:uncharacterized protein B0I36DRAFT_375379 [Microdochium trichocladiopsis]KAH7027551.1 hypothetical protein B0I36DRAFT_375379 [Microdochium trichocladiopsis]
MKERYHERKQKIKGKVNPPGGFDSTPIPDAPQGYTVKFIFHRARNLPVSDFGSGSSDPFLTATLTTNLPKRHKEDPDLVFRTKTIRKSLEPEWEQEWIVANVPASGFRLKCRLYDEDWPDHDDRLGNVTLNVDSVSESWEGLQPPGQDFEVKKRAGSKRAYLLRACTNFLVRDHSITPHLILSAVVLGKSDPPHGQMYTVGPTYYFKHFSPMIGRMTGIKVNRNESDDHGSHDPQPANSTGNGRANPKTEKYDFQANEIQLAGPVPPKLYHRFVEFRPVIGMLFKNKGLRGKILNAALHHQHRRVYSFQKETEYGTFEPCTEAASLQFLRMCHFDQGGRIFTYVITLDGLMRFTETGHEFGIDLLSKHTMHSDAAVYIACSGEFFIRRLEKPNASEDPEPDQPTHPAKDVPGGPPHSDPPAKPQHYQLIIDNDSGTYRPDKSVLPDLHDFLERNLPGLGIVTLACDDPEDKKLKDEQFQIKKKEGRVVRMVANRSPSASSFSSDDISDLEDLDASGDRGRMSKREKVLDVLADPNKIKDWINGRKRRRGSSDEVDGAVVS